MIQISHLSTEYIRYQVNAIVGGITPYNPTADVVQFAFTNSGNTAPVTWYSGVWETDSTAGTQYVAKCLVGPAALANPGVGTWTVWVKITDSPEVPVKQPGQLKIY